MSETVSKDHELSPLSAKQQTALAALLASPTVNAAAEAAGVTARTMFRYLADPVFNRAFRDGRRAAVDHSLAALQTATAEAVEALRRAMKCGKPTVEVMAARSVLELSIRAVELQDVIERIEELERRAAAQNGRAV